MAQDLRSFVDAVKRAKPDDVQVVKKEVDPAYEITALVVKLEREQKDPLEPGQAAASCVGDERFGRPRPGAHRRAAGFFGLAGRRPPLELRVASFSRFTTAARIRCGDRTTASSPKPRTQDTNPSSSATLTRTTVQSRQVPAGSRPRDCSIHHASRGENATSTPVPGELGFTDATSNVDRRAGFCAVRSAPRASPSASITAVHARRRFPTSEAH